MIPELTQSATVASRLVWRETSGSTNAELVALRAATPADWPDFSVLATDDQTAGRGRRDRGWESPPGASLAISVLLKPGLSPEHVGWIPLVAGLAMSRAVALALRGAGVSPSRVSVKWPNDVLVGDQKICGVLAELIVTEESHAVVVVGAGVNVALTRDQRPVATATSLALEGAPHVTTDELLHSYLAELKKLYSALVSAGGDARAAGISEQVSMGCSTLGARVRVDLPGGEQITGRATNLDPSGHLVVFDESSRSPVTVAAGDVVHVRPTVEPGD